MFLPGARRSVRALLMGTVLAFTSLVATPATADPGVVTATRTAESTMQSFGLLTPIAASSERAARLSSESEHLEPSGSLSTKSGLTVEYRNHSVGITPGTAVRSASVGPSGALVYNMSDSYDYAFTGAGHVLNAGFALIKDQAAPSDYRFDVTVDGEPAILEFIDHSVAVKDSHGRTVNFINPAWASDSTGAPVRTSFSIDGGTLVQRVHHTGASYPVVADPSLACDIAFCTIMLNRTETKTASQSTAAAAGLLCGSMTAAFAPSERCAALTAPYSTSPQFKRTTLASASAHATSL